MEKTTTTKLHQKCQVLLIGNHMNLLCPPFRKLDFFDKIIDESDDSLTPLIIYPLGNPVLAKEKTT